MIRSTVAGFIVAFMFVSSSARAQSSYSATFYNAGTSTIAGTETYPASAVTCGPPLTGGSTVIQPITGPAQVVFDDPASTTTPPGNCAAPSATAPSLPAGKNYEATLTRTTSSGTSGPSARTAFSLAAIPPLILTCPAPVTMSASGPTAVTFSNGTTSGGISPVSIVNSPASGSIFPVGATPVTETATSLDGQTQPCTFTVTVKLATESPDPTFDPPATSIVDSGLNVWTFGPSGQTLRNGVQVSSPGGLGVGTKYEYCGKKMYVYGGAWFGWDGSLFQPLASQAEPCTVIAPPPPLVLSCPSNQPPVISATPTAVTFPQATATGGVPPVQIAETPPSGSTFPLGTSTVTATATSSDGQAARPCTFTVTVTAPPPPPPPTCPTGTNAIALSVIAYPSTAKVGVPFSVSIAWSKAGLGKLEAYLDAATAAVMPPPDPSVTFGAATIQSSAPFTISKNGGTLLVTPTKAGPWHLWLSAIDQNGLCNVTGVIRTVTVQ